MKKPRSASSTSAQVPDPLRYRISRSAEPAAAAAFSM
jgi:hypothetical protein